MFTKILVPVDIAEPGYSQRVIEAAKDLARRDGARIRVLTVLERPASGMALYLSRDMVRKAFDEAKARVGDLARKISGPKDADSNVRQGTVYHEVIEEAREWGADLIVMDSHRPSISTYLLGSNAARIVRHADCSVLVIRDQG